MTPTGLKKIQAIPINRITENKSQKKKLIPQTSIAVNLPVKRAARSTKSSFYVDSSEDSDEPISKVSKKNHKAVKKSSDENKSNKKAKKTKISSNFVKTSKKANKLQNTKNKSKNKSSKYLTKTLTKDKQSKSNYNKMIQKRTQRMSSFKGRVDYNYLAKKGEKNNRNEKKCITTKKKTNLQIKKQRKTLDDYLPLIRKYRQLIPENQPFVRIERLKFNAAHFTNEQIRLTSDIDLFRDGAAFYGLLGNIFNHLSLTEKLGCSIVCRLWNRALNEDAAWHNIPLKNLVLHDLRALERLVLKRETKVIFLNNVDIVGKAVDYELCRLSSVKELNVQEPSSSLLLKKLIIACNELENVFVTDSNLHDLSNINIYIRKLDAQNVIVSETENRLLKTWSDLESLSVHSFDPKFYYNMGLLLSLKHLKLKQLSITNNISQFIENIPNIEYIEFAPEYSNINFADGNKAIVESLKHCPSLKRLTWITVKEISIKKEKVQIKTIKNEIPVVELNDINISLAKTENTQQSTLFKTPESLNKAELENLNVCNETEKMEVDVCIPEEKSDSDNQMEAEEVSKTISQQQDNKNIEIFDCLKTFDENKSSAIADKKFENEVGSNDKKDEIKQDFENIKEDLSSMANEHILVKNEEEEQRKSIEIHTESLQLLALKTYLKSSLSECEVRFKIVKKINYVD